MGLYVYECIDVRPVSYTHLDVYKRQGTHFQQAESIWGLKNAPGFYGAGPGPFALINIKYRGVCRDVGAQNDGTSVKRPPQSIFKCPPPIATFPNIQ